MIRLRSFRMTPDFIAVVPQRLVTRIEAEAADGNRKAQDLLDLMEPESPFDDETNTRLAVACHRAAIQGGLS